MHCSFNIKRCDGPTSFRVPLQDWVPSGNPESLNTNYADLPLMHRVGERNLTTGLGISPTVVDFGDVMLGSVGVAREITITNPNDYAVDLQEISLPINSGFSHTGVNQMVAKQSSISFKVRPKATSMGTLAANLTIVTDNQNTYHIPLSVNVIAEPPSTRTPTAPPIPTSSPNNSNNPSGGGGGMFSLYGLLMFTLLVLPVLGRTIYCRNGRLERKAT